METTTEILVSTAPREIRYRRFELRQQEGVFVVRFADGNLCPIAVTAELNDELIQLIETNLPRAIIFDLSNVMMCSTALVSSMLRTRKRLQVYGGHVALCGLNAHVRRSLEMLHLDMKIFPIFDNWLDALSEATAPAVRNTPR